ncbi:MAG: acyl-CoA thioesterase [Gemmatimonadota bacterium]
MEAEPIPGSRTEIRVRYAETDQMGHAHHMNYLAWFELGRTELMRANGLSYGELERNGTLLPVSRAQLEYRQGAAYDDRVWIHTRVEQVRSRSVTFAYEAVRAEDEALLARGSTTLVCTNKELEVRRIPDDAVRILSRLEKRGRIAGDRSAGIEQFDL